VLWNEIPKIQPMRLPIMPAISTMQMMRNRVDTVPGIILM